MMAHLRHNLGSLERAILLHVADGGTILARDITAHFEKKTGRARTTVLTVMERLTQKGYLKRSKVGYLLRYKFTVSRATLLAQIVGTFVDEALEGRIAPLVAYASKSRKLSGADARTLGPILARLEANERGGKRQAAD